MLKPSAGPQTHWCLPWVSTDAPSVSVPELSGRISHPGRYPGVRSVPARPSPTKRSGKYSQNGVGPNPVPLRCLIRINPLPTRPLSVCTAAARRRQSYRIYIRDAMLGLGEIRVPARAWATARTVTNLSMTQNAPVGANYRHGSYNRRFGWHACT